MTQNTVFVGEPAAAQKNRGRKQNRYFKTEARRTLFSKDNFHNSVISHLVCGLLSGGLLYLSFTLPQILNDALSGTLSERALYMLISTVNVVICVISAFLLFSFFFGVYTMHCMMREQDGSAPGTPRFSELSYMLTPVSGGRFRSTALYFMILALQLCAVVIPTALICDGAGYVLHNALALFAVRAVLICACAFLCIFSVSLFLPLPYVLARGESTGALAAYGQSASAAFNGVFRFVGLLISFIPLLLLSALSFGVLFFAYTMPYMTLSAAKLGEYLYNTANTERSTINE